MLFPTENEVNLITLQFQIRVGILVSQIQSGYFFENSVALSLIYGL